MKKVNTRNLLLIVGVSAYPLIATLGQESLEDRAARIHREAIVLDTHIDTTQHMIEEPTWNFFARHEPPSGYPRFGAPQSHVDLPRMRDGGLDGAFFSIWVPGTMTGPPAVKRSLEEIAIWRRLASEHPSDFKLCVTAEDV